MIKRLVLVLCATACSMLVAADCSETCQEKFDECMKASHSTGKQKICGEILHDCKLDCKSNGE